MIFKEESRNCIEIKNKYIIIPQLSWWNRKNLDADIRKFGKNVYQTTLNIRVIKFNMVICKQAQKYY